MKISSYGNFYQNKQNNTDKKNVSFNSLIHNHLEALSAANWAEFPQKLAAHQTPLEAKFLLAKIKRRMQDITEALTTAIKKINERFPTAEEHAIETSFTLRDDQPHLRITGKKTEGEERPWTDSYISLNLPNPESNVGFILKQRKTPLGEI